VAVVSDDEAPAAGDARFVAEIPDVYERLLVPIIFAEPAERLAGTIASLEPHDVLETAAGTGVLTRAVRRRLPGAAITATDLNADMLAEAQRRSPDTSATWQVADALDLPFSDASFDVVACQFGAMFFPDRVAGYAEARRVLRPGGAFTFSVWDGLAANDFPRLILDALLAAVTEGTAPGDPLQFLRRTPYGHGDPARLTEELARAGLTATVTQHRAESTATATDAAVAFCQGTPLRGAVEQHPQLGLDRATAIAGERLRAAYGDAAVATPMSWFEVVAVR
jgi:ubiquinone/menaquinone biosynthesis C-methylase UbiE